MAGKMPDREKVFDRQGGWCWWCGGRLRSDFAVHHRKLRKQGGTNEPSNLLALHHECHSLGGTGVHARVALAYERGFLVRSWAVPRETYVRTIGGGKVLLPDTWEQVEIDGR